MNVVNQVRLEALYSFFLTNDFTVYIICFYIVNNDVFWKLGSYIEFYVVLITKLTNMQKTQIRNIFW